MYVMYVMYVMFMKIPDEWILGDGIQHAMTGSGPWSMIRRRFDAMDAEAYKQMRNKINNGAFSKAASSVAAASSSGAASGEPSDASMEMRPSEAVPSLPLSNNQVLFDEILALSLVVRALNCISIVVLF
jgi:hypothetical protein